MICHPPKQPWCPHCRPELYAQDKTAKQKLTEYARSVGKREYDRHGPLK